MNKEKISIIIPVYNAEKTLDRCLVSIINQTYKNFEVILVDDASSDSSGEVIKKYLADGRFSYHLLSHGGVSKARNFGLSVATGKYLMFVDSDDDIKSNMIEKMIGLLERNRAELAVCRFNHPHFKTYCKNKVYNIRNYKQFMYLFQETFLITVPWNKVWLRDKITEKFDEDVAFAEDELFNVSNLKNVKRVVTTSESLYNYFCPPKAEGDSAMQRIISQQAFWESKSSPYFKGVGLVPKRVQIISEAIRAKKFPVKKVDELKFIRVIDYAFWLLPSFIDSGVSKFGLEQEWFNVIRDPCFKAGFCCQEKFGFKLINFEDDTLRQKINQFISYCCEIYNEKKSDPKFKPVYAFITLFMLMFTKQIGILKLVNFQAKFLHDYYWQLTREARFLKQMIANLNSPYDYELHVKQFA